MLGKSSRSCSSEDTKGSDFSDVRRFGTLRGEFVDFEEAPVYGGSSLRSLD